MFDASVFVRIAGFPATLIHGDPLVLDRWLWLKKRLPLTGGGEKLIDLGCGSGAFTIGAALRGYRATGLSWDERNQKVAAERAGICKAHSAVFEIFDIRQLGERQDLREQFDVAICLETIEHVLDDGKLMRDMAGCLKPGGRLLLTTPYYHYRPITRGDDGPYSEVEDGSHVRRGYTGQMLEGLCKFAGLTVEDVTFCSGFLSQKICFLMRVLSKIHPLLGWAVILPVRLLPPIFDRLVTNGIGWPHYIICLEAYKPRRFSCDSRQSVPDAMNPNFPQE